MFTNLTRRLRASTLAQAARHHAAGDSDPKHADRSKTPQTRCPRIGVIHRGNMVAERRFERRADVSIGRRMDANVMIDRDGIPDRLAILRVVDGRYHVVLPDDPNARLTLRGNPINNVTVRDGRQRLVPVEHAAGGSLQLGDLVIMFQLVPANAHTIVVHEETVLRVGLVFDGRLISDQVFADRKQVCIGRGKRDRIVLDSDYDGPSLCFRRHKDGTATLVVDEDVDLRVALPEQVPVDADALRSIGLAQAQRGTLHVHLPTGARGRTRLGPYTVLYQVLLRRTHVPMMPSRGPVGLLMQTLVRDPVWAVSLGLAAVLVCGVLGQALMFQQQVGRFQVVTQPQRDDHSRIWEVAVEELAPEKPEVPALKPLVDPVEAPKPAAKTAEKPAPRVRPTSVKPARKASRDLQVDPDDPRRNRRHVAARTIAGGLGRLGSKLVITDERGGDEHAFGSATAGQVGGDNPGGPTGGGLALMGAQSRPTVESVRVKRPVIARRSRVANLNVKPRKRPSKVVLDRMSLPGGADRKPAQRVGRVIARKASAVRRCYDRALRKDANISGKVSVSFTVGTAGTITRVVLSGASGPLGACIKSVFMRARGLPILSMPRVFRQSFVLTPGS